MKRTLLIPWILLIWIIPYMGILAQSTLIKGLVVDAEGLELPGVNVLIKNTTKGVMTSFDGKYAITGISVNDSIQFSYLGYTTQVFRIGSRDVLDVIMHEATTDLADSPVGALQK